MDGRPTVSADRVDVLDIQSAYRPSGRLRAGALAVPRLSAARRPHPSAAGAAAGRDRIYPARAARTARRAGRFSRRLSRHRLLVPLDRSGALLRRDGISLDGTADPAVE